jgi:D-threo-aldose 1-dehydrogenase
MRTVTLAGTELTTSVLGFGCNALLGEKTSTNGLALLDAAFDAGIRYFDVARVYGYGEAETLVGKFSKGKRTEILIATKFGIEPMVSVAGASFVRAAVRRLMQFSPALRSSLGRGARTAVKSGRFTPDAAHRSLDTSLRALGTDYIDVYLLHDCIIDDASDELLQFLVQARDEGKIRYFGVGTNPEQVFVICRDRPEYAAIVQFQNSLLSPELHSLNNAPGAVITHGALAGSYTAVNAYLSNNPDAARLWSCRVGADCSTPAALAAMMLSYAVRNNQRGPVLFRSSRKESIYANARVLAEEHFADEQFEALAGLARESGLLAV